MKDLDFQDARQDIAKMEDILRAADAPKSTIHQATAVYAGNLLSAKRIEHLRS